MNFALCGLLLVLLTATQAGRVDVNDRKAQDVIKLHEKCLPKFPVSKSILDDALYQQKYSSDPKFKAQVYCNAKLINYLDRRGQIQVDLLKEKLKNQLSDEEADAVIKKCAVQKNSPEETAFENLKCFYDNLPKNVSIWGT